MTLPVSLFISLLLFILAPWAASESTVHINGPASVALQSHLSFWLPEDPIDINSASALENAGKFQPIRSVTVPATHRDVWYRFTVNASSPYASSLILNFNEMLYNEVEVFLPRQGGWQSLLTGIIHPYDQRPVDYRFFAFPLVIDADQDLTIYFRINSTSQATAAPYLQTHDTFFATAIKQTILSVAIFGSIIGMIVYLLLTARTLLSPVTSFVFIGFLFTTLISVLFFDGLLSQLWDAPPQLNKIGHSIVMVSLHIFTLLFCSYFFNLANINRWLDYFACLLIGILIVIIIIVIAVGSTMVDTIFPQLTILTMLTITIAGIMAFQNKVPSSGYYLAAIGCYIFSIIYLSSAVTGAIAFDLTTRSLSYFGTLSLAFFITMAISKQLAINRRRIDNLNKKTIAAEAKDKAKTDFLATMSHEIRTPINGVLGMAQLLNESRLDSTQRHYVDILINSGKQLLHLINDILDLSKVEAGKLELENINFNLDQLLSYIVTSFSQTNYKRPIKFDIDVKYPIPFYIKGDPARLEQIINNLLSNAFKFTERGAITLSVICLQTVDGRANLKFSVSDTGQGIPANIIDQLFEPYIQAESSTNRKFGGTGLGLAISRRLVELMQGEIGIESTAGIGSNFWFTANFEIDDQREKLLYQTTQQLVGKHIVMVFSQPNATISFQKYLKKENIHYSIINSDIDFKNVDFDNIDFLLLSNGMENHTRRWLDEAQKHNIHILIFDNISNNCIDSHDPQWSTLKFINPPAPTSQIIEIIGQMLSNKDSSRSIDAPKFEPIKTLNDLKVLVAEDNIINIKVILAMLASHNIETDLAENGRQALEFFQAATTPYDLILMDCEMPEMDGFEATERIRALEISAHLERTTIYALTAHAMEENKLLCLAAGMDGVLTKPLRKEALMMLLESLAARSRSIVKNS